MSQALPGHHYCRAHKGNHSHYDTRNCTVCRLVAQLRRWELKRDWSDELREPLGAQTRKLLEDLNL